MLLTPWTKKIAKQLKKARITAGFSLGETAKLLHTTRQSIGSWEMGATMPRADVYLAALDLYGVDITSTNSNEDLLDPKND